MVFHALRFGGVGGFGRAGGGGVDVAGGEDVGGHGGGGKSVRMGELWYGWMGVCVDVGVLGYWVAWWMSEGVMWCQLVDSIRIF